MTEPVPRRLAEFSTEHVGVVDSRLAREYAAATNDPSPAYAAGIAVPPVFVVVATWPALLAGPAEALSADEVRSAVQAAHDIQYRRPLVPGETLTTEATLHALRGGPLGSSLTLRLRSRDAAGELVAEQYMTIFVRTMTRTVNFGPARPRHSFGRPSGVAPASVATFSIDPDQPLRYAGASGDYHQIHLDRAAAQAAGFRDVIAHGLCTLAMCGAALVGDLAGGDPRRVTRLAARFSKAVYPGSDVTVTAHPVAAGRSSTVYRFDAVSEGRPAITDGCLEVR